MKSKYVKAHMKAASVYAELSSAKRLQVGCVIVKNNTIIGIGYNGMPVEWNNICETKEYFPRENGGWIDPPEIEKEWPLTGKDGRRYRLKTKPEVLHAESNALAKVARSTNSSEGASLFVTHAPCLECAKMIYQAGIAEVIYEHEYKNNDGLEFLMKCRVRIYHVQQ